MTRHLVAFSCMTALLCSCSLLSPKQSLKPQLEEVETLESSLQARWDEAKASFEATVQDAEAFSNRNIDTEKVDTRLVRETILDGEDSGAAAREAVEAAMSGEEVDLETVDSVEETIALGQKVQSNLNGAIPALLDSLSEDLVDVGVQASRIAGEAEAMREVVDENVLMSQAEKQTFYADHERLTSELEAMQGFAEAMLADVEDLRARLVDAQTGFQNQLDTAFQP